MSRRHQKTEQEFGSDSFLDVIANIVGILIILIVIVGMKVARQPTLASMPTEQPAAVAEIPPDPDSPMLQKLQAARQELAELQQNLTSLDAEADELKSVDASMSQQLQQLEIDSRDARRLLTSLRKQSNLESGRAAEQDRKQDQLRQKLSALHQQISLKTDEEQRVTQALVTAVAERDQTDKSLQQAAFETQQLHEVLQDLKSAAAPEDILQHRLSPVGEKVEDGEVHFRVEEGKVSYIPIDEMLGRLKAQVQSRRSAVTRLARYESFVGPVQGYRMSFVVERESLSPMESLQYNSGTYRVSVTKWTILPEPGLQAEPVDEALQPGSRFRQVIDTSPPGSAATFWIYPDSFNEFPRLREIAHGLQLRVAARPLPAGTPIVGSPGGSRSSAQ